MNDLRADEIEAFRRDGVVALRQKFAPIWLERLRETIDASLLDPGPNLARHTQQEGAPGYFEDFWCWSASAAFTEFVHESPAASLAAQLLDAPSVNLVMDNWFMREAGSTSRPPFHHDISYFDFVGSMCVLWLPLAPIAAQEGISFVRGSHLWNRHFMRVRFADGHSLDTVDADTPVAINGVTYESPPDVAADPEAFDLVSFDLAAGDCIFFDMRTLHGALPSGGPRATGYRYTLRMSGPDGRIAYRGDWAAEERAMFEAAGYSDGDPIAGDFFPQLYPPVNR